MQLKIENEHTNWPFIPFGLVQKKKNKKFLNERTNEWLNEEESSWIISKPLHCICIFQYSHSIPTQLNRPIRNERKWIKWTVEK